jgi:hypothetical protein
MPYIVSQWGFKPSKELSCPVLFLSGLKSNRNAL